MTRHDIIRELFINSPEMTDYLCKDGSFSDIDMLFAICGAPVSLVRKAELLKECAKMQLVCPSYFRMSESLNDLCNGLITEVESAIASTKSKTGEVFLWKSCCYRPECNRATESCCQYAICPDIDNVLRNDKEAYDGLVSLSKSLPNEECDRLSEWSLAEKYVPAVDKKSRNTMEHTWNYRIVNGEICYAVWWGHYCCPIEDTELHKGKDYENSIYGCCRYVPYDLEPSIWEGHYLEIGSPFKHGDIVTIDCRPFADVHHGVIICNKGEYYGGAVAYVDDNGKLCAQILRHSTCFTYRHTIPLSPFYRIATYTDKLTDDEEQLYNVRERLLNAADDNKRERIGVELYDELNRDLED